MCNTRSPSRSSLSASAMLEEPSCGVVRLVACCTRSASHRAGSALMSTLTSIEVTGIDACQNIPFEDDSRRLIRAERWTSGQDSRFFELHGPLITMQPLALAPLLALIVTASASAVPRDCNGPTTLSTYIGKDSNVKLEVSQCDNAPLLEVQDIAKRDNVCGNNCEQVPAV